MLRISPTPGTSSRRPIGVEASAADWWRIPSSGRPALGFDAIQFNLVFESNPARTMYEALGWTEVGRVPHAVEGEDAIVYWRSLASPPPPGRSG